jgi:hypothetical protein
MTQAQKVAKDKFKKAIEYRKKTGVSLKEAFAHIYGKKVGAVKKKAAPKKAATKKAASKKSAPKKSVEVSKMSKKQLQNALTKKLSDSGISKDFLKNNFVFEKLGSIKKKKSAPKKVASKRITDIHKDSKSHNVNIRVVSGVGSIVNKTMKEISDTKNIILEQSALLERLQSAYKKSKSKINKEMIMMDIKTLKNNFIPHNKRYLKSLQLSLKKSL